MAGVDRELWLEWIESYGWNGIESYGWSGIESYGWSG